MKTPFKPKDRKKWCSEALNTDAFDFIETGKRGEGIPDAAVAWEHYRYLFFTDQLPPFWNHYISVGGEVELPGRLVGHALPAMLGYKRFQTHAWHELDAGVQDSIAKRYGVAPAVRLEPHKGSTLSSWAQWASQQLAEWNAGEPSSDLDKFTRSLSAEPLERGESADKSQIILEVNWSCGLQAIKADFAKAIKPVLKKHLPEGRKSRAKSNAKALCQLLFLKRHKIGGLPRKQAAFIVTDSGVKSIFYESEPEYSRAVKEACERLEDYAARLADLAPG